MVDDDNFLILIFACFKNWNFKVNVITNDA